MPKGRRIVRVHWNAVSGRLTVVRDGDCGVTITVRRPRNYWVDKMTDLLDTGETKAYMKFLYYWGWAAFL